jgi:hypothetical protein
MGHDAKTQSFIGNDWREQHSKNYKLFKALVELNKLNVDMEYVTWLMELIRLEESFDAPRALKDITVHLPPWPALSGAAELAKARSRHESDVKEGELRSQLERGDWQSGSHLNPNILSSASRKLEQDIRRLIVEAYMRKAIQLAESREVEPAPEHPHGTSPLYRLAPLTSNALVGLKMSHRETQGRRRKVYNQGRPLDIFSSFFLLALSERIRARCGRPHYEQCGEVLVALRQRSDKGPSAKVRVHQFKKTFPDWSRLLDCASHDFNQ